MVCSWESVLGGSGRVRAESGVVGRRRGIAGPVLVAVHSPRFLVGWWPGSDPRADSLESRRGGVRVWVRKSSELPVSAT